MSLEHRFQHALHRQLTTFWQSSADNFRTLARCSFLDLAVQALKQGHLKSSDFQSVVDSVIGTITWPVTLQMLQATHPASSNVRALNLDGHVAIHVLLLVEDSGRQSSIYRAKPRLFG